MRRVAFSLATLMLAAACADQRSPVAPASSLASRAPSTTRGTPPPPKLPSGVCTRRKGPPIDHSFSFTATAGTAATLHVKDNGELGLNGTITLNGEEVVTHPMFYGNSPVNLSVPITLAKSNVLVCELEGKPGSGLSWTVTVP